MDLELARMDLEHAARTETDAALPALLARLQAVGVLELCNVKSDEIITIKKICVLIKNLACILLSFRQ